MKIDYDKYPLPKRLRHHVSPNLYMSANELKKVPSNYPSVPKEINWSDVFLNGKKPDVLDVGCGKGSFLLNLAVENPDKNYLGIELRKPLVEWVNGVVAGEEIKNCAALRYSVANGLPFIQSESIERVFYLFPDPWLKKKHQKRRAFNLDFLAEINRVLKKGGEFYLATDSPKIDGYHWETLEEFGELDCRLVVSDELWDLPTTDKERFCLDKNVPIFRIKCGKPF